MQLTRTANSNAKQEVIDWVSPLEFDTKHSEVLATHTLGTGQSFLDSSKFQDWVDGQTRVLWCHGMRKSIRFLLEAVMANKLRFTML